MSPEKNDFTKGSLIFLSLNALHFIRCYILKKYASELHHEALCLHEYSPISFVDYSNITFIKVLFFSKHLE